MARKLVMVLAVLLQRAGTVGKLEETLIDSVISEKSPTCAGVRSSASGMLAELLSCG